MTMITTVNCGYVNEALSETVFSSAISTETNISVMARIFESNSFSGHTYAELILYQQWEDSSSGCNSQFIITSEKHFILLIRFLHQITSITFTPVPQQNRCFQADYLLNLCLDRELSRQHTISMLPYLEWYIIITKSEAFSSMPVGDYNT